VPIEGVVGIGIAVPCPLHPDRPDQLLPRILPAWADVRLSLHLEEVFGRPVFIDNDANLGALAEAWWGPGIGRGDVAFVKLDVGVGAGLLVDGEVYHGASGVAGEIGHTAIDPRGPLCRCGLSGCLEAMVGSDSLLGQYPGEDRPPSIAALVDAAEGGDADADRLITSAGRNLGVALANLMNLLNPSVVVLSGPLTHAGERLLVPLRAAMTERALWTSVADVDLLISPLGPAGIARGAAALVLQTALERPTLFREAQLETPQLEEPCVP